MNRCGEILLAQRVIFQNNAFFFVNCVSLFLGFYWPFLHFTPKLLLSISNCLIWLIGWHPIIHIIIFFFDFLEMWKMLKHLFCSVSEFNLGEIQTLKQTLNSKLSSKMKRYKERKRSVKKLEKIYQECQRCV